MSPDSDNCHYHGRLQSLDWDNPQCVAESSIKSRPGYDTFDASEYIDTPKTMNMKIKLLSSMIKQKHNVLVYTGAGISTSSGIGDYASKADKSVAPHLNSKQSSIKSKSRLDLEPTFTHKLLAAMEQKGYLHHWIQQNHDRLAQKAGYPQNKLNEIHGAWGDNKNPVLMMDDNLRKDLIEWLERWTDKTDLVIAIGTSLCGMTADIVVEKNLDKLVIINLQKTKYDDKCALRIWGLIDDIAVKLAKKLKLKIPNRRCQERGNQWVQRHPRCKYNTPRVKF